MRKTLIFYQWMPNIISTFARMIGGSFNKEIKLIAKAQYMPMCCFESVHQEKDNLLFCHIYLID